MPITAIAILENTAAGNGDVSRIAHWLSVELTNRQIVSSIFNQQWPVSLAEYSDIWLIGGDGTINYFINHYPDCDKPIALFKGGTGNDFAWKLYGDCSIAEQLEKVLIAKPQLIDAGKFNNTLFINCIGIGFDGEIIRSMNAIRFLGGHVGYLLAVILKIFSFREYTFSIHTKNEHWKEKFLLVMVGNSSRAGGGFIIAPDAAINDGELNMVLCKKLSVWKRLRYLPIIKKGKHMHLPFVIHRPGFQFSIHSEKEMSVQADGELLFAKDIEVSIIPGKFLFKF